MLGSTEREKQKMERDRQANRSSHVFFLFASFRSSPVSSSFAPFVDAVDPCRSYYDGPLIQGERERDIDNEQSPES